MPLLDPQIPEAAQHPNFKALVSRRTYRSAGRLLEDAFARLPARDGGFIKDFQGTEFDARNFELFVSELLRESGATFEAKAAQPDFEPTVGHVSFAVECTTVNSTKEGGVAQLRAYQALNNRDRTLDDLRDRLLNEVPVRFGGAILNKIKHRIKPDELPYWELPHVRGKPFVLAVETLHADGALGFSDAALSTYLYGIQHTPAWDNDGHLVVEQSAAASHRKASGQSIPSGFFSDPANAPIAGVLWANSGTLPKFARMALEGPYPDPDVTAIRVGTAYNPDPEAYTGREFLYVVGARPQLETWGEGCVLFHNPNAAHPLPMDLLANVNNAEMTADGRYVVHYTEGLSPFQSMTLLAASNRERIGARLVARRMYDAFAAVHEQMRANRGKDWWDGFRGGKAINSYRSDDLG